MKVDSTTQNQLNISVKPQKKTGGQPANISPADSASPKEEAFSIQISDKVKEMMTAEPAEDAIRLDKVAAIREQLAKGNYNISGKDVADKILNALKN